MRACILDCLHRWFDIFGEVALIVYFSGSGFQIEDGED